jgi:hypothetical protein
LIIEELPEFEEKSYKLHIPYEEREFLSSLLRNSHTEQHKIKERGIKQFYHSNSAIQLRPHFGAFYVDVVVRHGDEELLQKYERFFGQFSASPNGWSNSLRNFYQGDLESRAFFEKTFYSEKLTVASPLDLQ